jgi:hypothetical protein
VGRAQPARLVTNPFAKVRASSSWESRMFALGTWQPRSTRPVVAESRWSEHRLLTPDLTWVLVESPRRDSGLVKDYKVTLS